MARMPDAIWLGEHSPRTPMDRYDVVCVHTIVGYAPAHAAHFSVKADGTIQQSRDTAYRSAANLHGNHRVISIENEDHGAAFGSWGGSDVPALTDAQVESNAKILRWAHATHGIPLQLCPDSRPGSRGLGYHRQGIDGNFTDGYDGRVDGGETWTEHFGKVCPGPRRIAQIPTILNLAIGTPPEDIMASKEELAELLDRKIGPVERQSKKNGRLTYNRDQKIMEAVAALADAVADTATKAQVRRLAQEVAALSDDQEGA